MMSIIAPCSIFFLFLFFPQTPNSATSKPAVLDINGRPLRTNAMYYMVPSNAGQGGGLTMTPRNDTSPCPLYVTQHKEDMYPGLPVWFLPVNTNSYRIFPSTDYNIIFNAVNRCLQSAGWQLIQEKATRRRYVVTGGAIGDPGEKTVDSWFQIEKAGSGKYEYKIVFCPGVCPSCMVRCGHLGVFVQDGKLLLGVAGRALLFTFKKA